MLRHYRFITAISERMLRSAEEQKFSPFSAAMSALDELVHTVNDIYLSRLFSGQSICQSLPRPVSAVVFKRAPA